MAEAAGPAPRAPTIRVTVVYSPQPRVVHEWELVLPTGATVQQAIEASGLRAEFPDFDLQSSGAGVWGRKATAGQPLREQDRVEIYRPLKVDPKLARRERFRRQGARAAGLFARKRNGAGPGG
jgi:putative ubiquitin-RnfH superfamily antitoxin RatB of RatAB toxin-antitoxin module